MYADSNKPSLKCLKLKVKYRTTNNKEVIRRIEKVIKLPYCGVNKNTRECEDSVDKKGVLPPLPCEEKKRVPPLRLSRSNIAIRKGKKIKLIKIYHDIQLYGNDDRNDDSNDNGALKKEKEAKQLFTSPRKKKVKLPGVCIPAEGKCEADSNAIETDSIKSAMEFRTTGSPTGKGSFARIKIKRLPYVDKMAALQSQGFLCKAVTENCETVSKINVSKIDGTSENTLPVAPDGSLPDIIEECTEYPEVCTECPDEGTEYVDDLYNTSLEHVSDDMLFCHTPNDSNSGCISCDLKVCESAADKLSDVTEKVLNSQIHCPFNNDLDYPEKQKFSIECSDIAVEDVEKSAASDNMPATMHNIVKHNNKKFQEENFDKGSTSVKTSSLENHEELKTIKIKIIDAIRMDTKMVKVSSNGSNTVSKDKPKASFSSAETVETQDKVLGVLPKQIKPSKSSETAFENENEKDHRDDNAEKQAQVDIAAKFDVPNLPIKAVERNLFETFSVANDTNATVEQATIADLSCNSTSSSTATSTATTTSCAASMVFSQDEGAIAYGTNDIGVSNIKLEPNDSDAGQDHGLLSGLNVSDMDMDFMDITGEESESRGGEIKLSCSFEQSERSRNSIKSDGILTQNHERKPLEKALSKDGTGLFTGIPNNKNHSGTVSGVLQHITKSDPGHETESSHEDLDIIIDKAICNSGTELKKEKRSNSPESNIDSKSKQAKEFEPKKCKEGVEVDKDSRSKQVESTKSKADTKSNKDKSSKKMESTKSKDDTKNDKDPLSKQQESSKDDTKSDNDTRRKQFESTKSKIDTKTDKSAVGKQLESIKSEDAIKSDKGKRSKQFKSAKSKIDAKIDKDYCSKEFVSITSEDDTKSDQGTRDKQFESTRSNNDTKTDKDALSKQMKSIRSEDSTKPDKSTLGKQVESTKAKYEIKTQKNKLTKEDESNSCKVENKTINDKRSKQIGLVKYKDKPEVKENKPCKEIESETSKSKIDTKAKREKHSDKIESIKPKGETKTNQDQFNKGDQPTKSKGETEIQQDGCVKQVQSTKSKGETEIQQDGCVKQVMSTKSKEETEKQQDGCVKQVQSTKSKGETEIQQDGCVKQVQSTKSKGETEIQQDGCVKQVQSTKAQSGTRANRENRSNTDKVNDERSDDYTKTKQPTTGNQVAIANLESERKTKSDKLNKTAELKIPKHEAQTHAVGVQRRKTKHHSKIIKDSCHNRNDPPHPKSESNIKEGNISAIYPNKYENRRNKDNCNKVVNKESSVETNPDQDKLIAVAQSTDLNVEAKLDQIKVNIENNPINSEPETKPCEEKVNKEVETRETETCEDKVNKEFLPAKSSEIKSCQVKVNKGVYPIKSSETKQDQGKGNKEVCAVKSSESKPFQVTVNKNICPTKSNENKQNEGKRRKDLKQIEAIDDKKPDLEEVNQDEDDVKCSDNTKLNIGKISEGMVPTECERPLIDGDVETETLSDRSQNNAQTGKGKRKIEEELSPYETDARPSQRKRKVELVSEKSKTNLNTSSALTQVKGKQDRSNLDLVKSEPIKEGKKEGETEVIECLAGLIGEIEPQETNSLLIDKNQPEMKKEEVKMGRDVCNSEAMVRTIQEKQKKESFIKENGAKSDISLQECSTNVAQIRDLAEIKQVREVGEMNTDQCKVNNTQKGKHKLENKGDEVLTKRKRTELILTKTETKTFKRVAKEPCMTTVSNIDGLKTQCSVNITRISMDSVFNTNKSSKGTGLRSCTTVAGTGLKDVKLGAVMERKWNDKNVVTSMNINQISPGKCNDPKMTWNKHESKYSSYMEKQPSLTGNCEQGLPETNKFQMLNGRGLRDPDTNITLLVNPRNEKDIKKLDLNAFLSKDLYSHPEAEDVEGSPGTDKPRWSLSQNKSKVITRKQSTDVAPSNKGLTSPVTPLSADPGASNQSFLALVHVANVMREKEQLEESAKLPSPPVQPSREALHPLGRGVSSSVPPHHKTVLNAPQPQTNTQPMLGNRDNEANNNIIAQHTHESGPTLPMLATHALPRVESVNTANVQKLPGKQSSARKPAQTLEAFPAKQLEQHPHKPYLDSKVINEMVKTQQLDPSLQHILLYGSSGANLGKSISLTQTSPTSQGILTNSIPFSINQDFSPQYGLQSVANKDQLKNNTISPQLALQMKLQQETAFLDRHRLMGAPPPRMTSQISPSSLITSQMSPRFPVLAPQVMTSPVLSKEPLQVPPGIVRGSIVPTVGIIPVTSPGLEPELTQDPKTSTDTKETGPQFVSPNVGVQKQPFPRVRERPKIPKSVIEQYKKDTHASLQGKLSPKEPVIGNQNDKQSSNVTVKSPLTVGLLQRPRVPIPTQVSELRYSHYKRQLVPNSPEMVQPLVTSSNTDSELGDICSQRNVHVIYKENERTDNACITQSVTTPCSKPNTDPIEQQIATKSNVDQSVSPMIETTESSQSEAKELPIGNQTKELATPTAESNEVVVEKDTTIPLVVLSTSPERKTHSENNDSNESDTNVPVSESVDNESNSNEIRLEISSVRSLAGGVAESNAEVEEIFGNTILQQNESVIADNLSNKLDKELTLYDADSDKEGGKGQTDIKEKKRSVPPKKAMLHRHNEMAAMEESSRQIDNVSPDTTTNVTTPPYPKTASIESDTSIVRESKSPSNNTPISKPTKSKPDGAAESITGHKTEDLWKALLMRRSLTECVCGASFTSPALYMLHQACHNTDEPHWCATCSSKCSTWMDFFVHLYDHQK